ncbi:MAG: transcription termination/antitermination NusG family protein [Hyphomicrobium sp.]
MRTEYSDYCGSPSNWAVVNTHPHREQVAVENLQRQEFHAYCPMVRRQRRHARRVTDVLRPLFPGYLFTQVNSDMQRWRPMLSTFGVRAVVRCGDRLSLIEDAFIQSLMDREVDGAIARPVSPYRVGQEVRMAGGAFDGLVATIVDMDERDRLTVLMDLMNRPIKVKIEERQISPV